MNPDHTLNTAGLDIRASIRLLEVYSTDQLPSPSEVARRLLTLSASDTASRSEIAQVVKADPALSGRLIKLANSPLIGFSRPVVVIDDAIILLGIQAVHKLAIGMSVLDRSRQGRCPEFDYDRFWRHCVLRAVSAQFLAAELRIFNPGEAFSVALLGDIGKLVLATMHPTVYARALSACALIDDSDKAGPTTLLALEREHFATDHAELTNALLMDWGFIDVHLMGLKLYYQREDPDQTSRAAGLARLIRGAESAAAHLDSEGDVEILADRLHALFPEGFQSVEETSAYVGRVGGAAEQWGSILELTKAGKSVPMIEVSTSKDEKYQAESPVYEFHEQSARILVADDDPMMRSVLTAVLVQDGYQIVESTDGTHALTICLRDTPDIVILDWEMPNLSGIQVCRTIRESRPGSLLYIIVLTAHSDEEHLVEAFSAGADDFIRKPVTSAELRARVAAGSRLVQLRRQVEQERTSSREHVARLTALARRMRDAALMDFLTGIPNRRCILNILNTHWSTSGRSRQALSCLMIDVDYFKAINDSFGHDVGDQVLQIIARLIRDNLREGDSVGRIGGEEFLVVAPLADREAAMQLCERLRSAVSQHDFGARSSTGHMTISIGIATREPDTAVPYDLVTRADAGLLEAKTSGRDRCRYARAAEKKVGEGRML